MYIYFFPDLFVMFMHALLAVNVWLGTQIFFLLCFTALYCSPLQSTVLYLAASHDIAFLLHCISLNCTASYLTALHCIVSHCIVSHCIVFHCIVSH